MKINDKILEILKIHNIKKDDGISYLISLYYQLNPTFIPENIKEKIIKSKIITFDKKNIIFNIKLFENTENHFDWVKTEYIPLFKNKNKTKGGKVRESTIRMKSLFSNYPEIRKNDVIEATKFYLKCTEADFIRFPHYFIQKGVGVEKTNDILDWIDKVKELKNKNNTSLTNKIQ